MEDIEYPQDIKGISKRYKKYGYGHIAKLYSKQEEMLYYKMAANMLSNKFSHLISSEEIIDVLSKKGRIFSVYSEKDKGIFLSKIGDICLPHFLNRMTTTLLHELIHKLGYLKENDDFSKMGRSFIESGTELVCAKTLSTEEERELIFGNVYAKFQNKTDCHFLSVCLVNQLNEALGGENLEESILKGKDLFSSSIIERFGKEKFIYLKKHIEDIPMLEKKYWSKEIEDRDDKNLKSKICIIQDMILKTEFDKRLENVDSVDKAEIFLKELIIFGENRVKFKEKKGDEFIFIDNEFTEHFNKYKTNLESRFKHTFEEYDTQEWEKKYKIRSQLVEISEEEKRALLHLSIEFKREINRRNTVSRLFKKGKTNKLKDSGTEIKSKLEEYIIEPSKLNVKEIQFNDRKCEKIELKEK